MDASVITRGLIRVIDDDPALRDSLSVLLRTVGYSVDMFPAAEACLAAPRAQPVCLVVDLELPGMGGVAFVEALRQQGDTSPVVLITGTVRTDLLERATRSKAAFVLRKPFDPEALLDAIEMTSALTE